MKSLIAGLLITLIIGCTIIQFVVHETAIIGYIQGFLPWNIVGEWN